MIRNEDNDPMIPFGKYRGKCCHEIPEGFLRWCLLQGWLKQGLREGIENYLAEFCDGKSVQVETPKRKEFGGIFEGIA